MDTRELLQKIRRIEITTRRAVHDQLAGQYHSVFKGRGMAFSEVRPYQPGDDVRAIDWNVTARLREPFIKVFTEERELTVIVAADLSASMDIGSRGLTKGEVAAEIAAMIGFSALSNNDRVGLALCTRGIERWVPPKKGRKHGLRVISEVLTFRPMERRTDIAASLEALRNVTRRRTVVFFISDFSEPAERYERALGIASRRHDLVPVVVTDPIDDAFPNELSGGLIDVVDAETGQRLTIDAGDSRIRELLAARVKAARERRVQAFARHGLDHIEVRAGDDFAGQLIRFFRARARRAAA